MVSEVDKKILELLQRDARIPISQIANEVNMSENGVKYRLDKLEKSGVIIRFALLVDPKKLGKSVKAIFDIELDSQKSRDSIPKLLQLDEFIQIYQTTGEHSFMAIGLFDNNESLTNFVNNKLLNEVPIRNYTINIITKSYKDISYLI